MTAVEIDTDGALSLDGADDGAGGVGRIAGLVGGDVGD